MQKYMDVAATRSRDARKARLHDPALLEIFMGTRRDSIMAGCTILEANQRAHDAVSKAEQHMGKKLPL